MYPQQPQHQLNDPRILGGMILVGITSLFTVLGDQVAFVRPPKNVIERVVGVIPEFFYTVLGDRLYANAATATLIAGILLVVGFKVIALIEKHYFKPRQVEKMMTDTETEEFLLQRLKDRRRSK